MRLFAFQSRFYNCKIVFILNNAHKSSQLEWKPAERVLKTCGMKLNIPIVIKSLKSGGLKMPNTKTTTTITPVHMFPLVRFCRTPVIFPRRPLNGFKPTPFAKFVTPPVAELNKSFNKSWLADMFVIFVKVLNAPANGLLVKFVSPLWLTDVLTIFPTVFKVPENALDKLDTNKLLESDGPALRFKDVATFGETAWPDKTAFRLSKPPIADGGFFAPWIVVPTASISVFGNPRRLPRMFGEEETGSATTQNNEFKSKSSWVNNFLYSQLTQGDSNDCKTWYSR